MAKKKLVEPLEEKDDELDELEDESLEDEDFESVYPKLEKGTKEDEKKAGIASIADDEGSEYPEEELEYEMEEEVTFPSYRYLNLEIKKDIGKNDYEVIVEGQSHGFCNILVKHLLEIEGVNIAAYKDTKIEPSTIFIRLEDSKKYKIKEILHKGIESLREEVTEVQKLFKKIT
ncbi:MAG: RpoL/Rpb11 RNA polymerase subunit family protein [Candidatus Hodarchaeota archaeon]